ncbi:hypothetical protein SLAV_36470 [Streptomyces lavendulae subsp. lavendulae]|uniref:Uncharacterized protein n=1 Tax=Streptomyces lavendulae subsp. lavendulae TaxID=58340 RepID=A0A2K8PQS1_STRLA|nr:hypothetical protein [Streptomyces lavendulae]ATZ29059.1 hypothetical protein SLAV_36470 [Streptomyces lavendulae subsp. lavendulae]
MAEKRLKSWGDNRAGQLGDGTTTDSSTLVTTLTALTGVDKIAAPVSGDFSPANKQHQTRWARVGGPMSTLPTRREQRACLHRGPSARQQLAAAAAAGHNVTNAAWTPTYAPRTLAAAIGAKQPLRRRTAFPAYADRSWLFTLYFNATGTEVLACSGFRHEPPSKAGSQRNGRPLSQMPHLAPAGASRQRLRRRGLGRTPLRGPSEHDGSPPH